MAVIDRAEPSKPKVAIYHSKGNSEVKNFAGRMRNDNKVDTVLVWSHLFRSDEDLLSVAALVIEVGAPNADLIERTYRAFDPDVEIHKMTPDGEWYDGEATQEVSQESQPALQTAPAAPAKASPDPVTGGDADDGSAVPEGSGEGEQPPESSSDSDEAERDK